MRTAGQEDCSRLYQHLRECLPISKSQSCQDKCLRTSPSTFEKDIDEKGILLKENGDGSIKSGRFSIHYHIHYGSSAKAVLTVYVWRLSSTERSAHLLMAWKPLKVPLWRSHRFFFHRVSRWSWRKTHHSVVLTVMNNGGKNLFVSADWNSR